MRVAMVSEHASPLAVLGGADAGGQNVHVASLALALARQGAEVVVYTRRDARALPDRVRIAAGVVVEHVAAGPPRPLAKDDLLPFMDAFAAILAETWSADPPDVVHAHFWMSGRAALDAARPLGVPVVQTFHALGVVKRRHQGARDTSPGVRLAIEAGIVREADAIVATCSDEVVELRAIGADPNAVTVVPCGVDTTVFRPDGPAEPRRRPHRLVSIGRLVERKGVTDVIRALAAIPETELVVAGGGDRASLTDDPEVRRLVRVARAVGVADRVSFRGRVSRADVPALLRSADVVVCVPWYEPFGIVPLEAMACGVPVVASAVGGMLDSVVDGVTGLHVPPSDPHGLATALSPLLADRQWRARLGAAGASRARRLYSWDRIAAATLEVYAAQAASRAGERLSERTA